MTSTGLKIYEAGEWHRDKHGVRGPRTWRKLHLAVDAVTSTIVAVTLTTTSDGDASQLGALLDQTSGPIDTVMAHGALYVASCSAGDHIRRTARRAVSLNGAFGQRARVVDAAPLFQAPL